MATFDYDAPAELYTGGGRGARRSQNLHYWRFDSAAQALQYAFEQLPPEELPTAMLEVDEVRYTGDELRALYAADRYRSRA
jgi:hypothetical protein